MASSAWKKTILVAGLALTCFAAGTYAAGPIQKIEAFLREDYKIKVDGELQQLTLPPIIYQDRTYLPVYEIGKFLNADVVWEADTKTIYVNPRISELQPGVSEDGPEQTYEEIELVYAMGLIASYLGRDYPVLSIMTMEGENYYRARDLERMGIDLRPLEKVQEVLTGELYIHESEAKQAWKQTPEWNYPYPQSTIITGETDPLKIEALLAYEPLELITYENEQPQWYPKKGQVIVIDKLSESENAYRMLFDASGELWQYELTLKSNEKQVIKDGEFVTELEWYVNSLSNKKLSKEDIN